MKPNEVKTGTEAMMAMENEDRAQAWMLEMQRKPDGAWSSELHRLGLMDGSDELYRRLRAEILAGQENAERARKAEESLRLMKMSEAEHRSRISVAVKVIDGLLLEPRVAKADLRHVRAELLGQIRLEREA